MAVQDHNCIIIGGGISGLMAATKLVENNIDVLVLDKGRRAGGRISTRESGNLRFDYGAQAIKSGSEEFDTFVRSWKDAGILELCNYHEDGDSDFPLSEYYCVKNGIARLPIYLANRLNLESGCRITGLSIEKNRWAALSSENRSYRADSLIMTPPSPQILEIIDVSDIGLPDEIHSSLKKIKYEKCITLLADCILSDKLKARGFFRPDNSAIALVVNNHGKGVSASPGALTIQTNSEFSEEYWDLEDDELIEKIIDYGRGYFKHIGGYLRIHRWRYSRAVNSCPDPFLITHDPGLIAFAGDGFSGEGIEGAAISGIRAAEAIIAKID
jgi:hypothetical protein